MRGTSGVVITSDLPVKSNGMPYATGRADDPGIAVWWLQGRPGDMKERVMACDVYKTHGENLRAIQLTIAALRGIDRWGASQITDRAFAGFTALPPGTSTPEAAPRDWWDVLEIPATHVSSLPPEDLLVIVKARFRKLAQAAHPDHGGSPEKMIELDAARDAAESYLANMGANNGVG